MDFCLSYNHYKKFDVSQCSECVKLYRLEGNSRFLLSHLIILLIIAERVKKNCDDRNHQKMLYQFLNDLSTPVEKEYLLCESCHMLAANSALCFCENTCENTCVTRGNCPHNERKNISSLQKIDKESVTYSI